ncbi:hypothetical protein [Nocardioides sp. cx-173]|uniref:hypothetical protein n=1 Tax=Nocardioides sp. cx-173 TaxID=2898796 RepID=UPI001E4A44DE|nr:hypothetical protein [Nocardioides sp. cx-173]MCD4525575.1 hypothetical protein [Nocardioides sp. cx-173]UGB42719.1 hypothetical protein LQ940_04130 [Nocardioides sp. cx-173]
MTRRAPVLALAAVLAAVTVAGVVVLTRDAGPDLVADDVVGVYAGFSESIRPMDNDHIDPSAGRICDVEDPDAAGLSIEFYDATGTIDVDANATLDPGRYVLGYTLCSGEERDSGEVAIVVRATPDVEVEVVGPGVLSITNPGDVPFWFDYGEGNDEAPRDGRFLVKPGRTERVRVQRHQIHWNLSYFGRQGQFYFEGNIDDTQLPPGVKPLGTMPPGIS